MLMQIKLQNNKMHILQILNFQTPTYQLYIYNQRARYANHTAPSIHSLRRNTHWVGSTLAPRRSLVLPGSTYELAKK
jgi:hypothetical protein